eukprot:scaffold619_cov150-Skeletonema_menzelii.AAC.21
MLRIGGKRKLTPGNVTYLSGTERLEDRGEDDGGGCVTTSPVAVEGRPMEDKGGGVTTRSISDKISSVSEKEMTDSALSSGQLADR